MLKKVIAVRNVGRFLSSALPPLPTFAKYTLIYGANGYGKTTLCTVLRSLGTNDPKLINGRARLGSTTPPLVELLLDGGPTKFANGAWSVSNPEVIVFDGSFIEDNVHSGSAVDLEHRRNLYRVIVGKQGVDLALEEDRLASESRNKGSEIKAIEKTIQSHVPQGMKIDEFIKLPPDSDIDAKIAAQTKSLAAVQEAAQLKARSALSEATFPVLAPGFEALLAKTLDDIAQDAQKLITDHIKAHAMEGHGDAWIAEGVQHIAEDSCPFCGQSVKGISLVEAYQKVFAQAYRDLKAVTSSMRTAVENALGERQAGTLETLFESNRGGIEFWSRYVKLPALNLPVEATKSISDLRGAAVALLSQKAATPQEPIALDAQFSAAKKQYMTARTSIDAYNAAIKASNAEIAAKKAAVAAADVKKEESALTRFSGPSRHTSLMKVAIENAHCDARSKSQNTQSAICFMTPTTSRIAQLQRCKGYHPRNQYGAQTS